MVGYLNVLVNALEKQIPKNPIRCFDNTPSYRCPNCNSGVATYEHDYKYPNCKWCGQKLSWDLD